MRRLWFSAYLLAASWMFAVPLYESPRPIVWGALVVVGCAFAVVGFLRVEVTARRATVGAFLLPAAAAALLVPHPLNTGVAVIALGLAVVAAHRRVAAAGGGLVFAGLMLTAQSVAVAAYHTIAPRLGDIGPLATLAGWGLRLLGASARTGPEGVLLENGLRTITFGRTGDLFALFAIGVFVAGGCVLVLLARRPRWHALGVFLGAALCYVIARFVVLALMFSVSGRIDLFWSGPATAISLFPLPILLASLVRTRLPHHLDVADLQLRNRRFWVAVACASLSIFVLLGVAALHDPGVRKQGRVIMDEAHSDWEWSTQALDTEWFGEKSGYNYYSLYQYLDLFYEMERNTEAITDELLSGCDVLIVKPPTEPFSPEERASIVRFVSAGGGLFLIGDHTNVFGSSTNMNPLAEEFGLRFNHDATYELTEGRLSEYEPPAVFPHPIVQHLPRFLFATSSSLRVAPGAEAVITGYGLKALPADYSQENFFPAVANAADMRFGLLLQGAAVRHGRGRVAAFSDSTVFSNFWMFMPGKPELALSYLEWLNRTNTPFGAWWLPLVIAAGLGALFWFVASRLSPSGLLSALMLGALVAVPVAVSAYPLVDRVSYPLPDARSDYVAVNFEQEYSVFAVPSTFAGFSAESTRSLHTFFVWNQRLGYVPSVKPSLSEALEDGDVVVIANPEAVPDADTIADVEQFVKEGGRLLVLADASGALEAANAFLKPWGMKAGPAAARPGAYWESGDGRRLALTPGAGVVTGGTVLVRTASGEDVCAAKRSGDGVVVAFADAQLFFDASLGMTSRVPDEHQRLVGELEFALMRFLAEDEPFAF